MIAERYFDGEPLRAAQAIGRDDIGELRKLVQGGVKPDTEGKEGETLLSFAVRVDKRDSLRELLQLGANPNFRSSIGWSAMAAAARADDEDLLRILLDSGGDPNLRDDVGRPIAFHSTPTGGLAPAAAADPVHWGKLELLLKRGADINATAPDGNNLVLYLALTEDWEQVAYLIERGADFQHKDAVGLSVPIEVQESRMDPATPGLRKVKQLLIERGVTFPVPAPPPTHPAPKAQ
jgi:ankyrin repeat protein